MPPDPPAGDTFAVLDTNVLLDWLLFADPRVAALVGAIETRRLVWIATPPMRDEFRTVLERLAGVARAPAHGSPDAAWARHCRIVPVPARSAAVPACRDRDDQMFVDLAIAARARWLVSRDRALLALAAPLRRSGIDAVTPERWIG